ncbi:Uncharacterised protein [Sphingobacterium daejeonense]|nr:Uncharacterised protein [Sphingobacterium daejeonense]
MLDAVLDKVGTILTKEQMSVLYFTAELKDIMQNKELDSLHDAIEVYEKDDAFNMNIAYLYLDELITVMSKKEQYELCDELQQTKETIQLEVIQEQQKK